MNEIEHLPYELTAEQLSKEAVTRIKEVYGDDPRTIFVYLPEILKEYGHDCIELGLGLAEKFPTIGPAELVEAFVAGEYYSREKGLDNGTNS